MAAIGTDRVLGIDNKLHRGRVRIKIGPTFYPEGSGRAGGRRSDPAVVGLDRDRHGQRNGRKAACLGAGPGGDGPAAHSGLGLLHKGRPQAPQDGGQPFGFEAGG